MHRPQLTIDVIRTLPLKKGKCRGCLADIEWVKTASGRLMPVNHPLTILSVHERNDGTLVCVIDAAQSHFVTCPEADTYRKKGKGHAGHHE